MRIHLVLIVSVISFAAGIAIDRLAYFRPTASDPISQFRQRHPLDAKRYTKLEQTSLLGSGMIAVENIDAGQMVAKSFKEKFGNDNGLRQYADKVVGVQTDRINSFGQRMSKLSNASQDGAIICMYERDDGQMGFIAINKLGDIVLDDPIIGN